MSDTESIALVGLACRFAGAASADELWGVLQRGAETVGDVPAERFDIDAWFDPRPGTPGKIVTRRGGLLPDVDRFDAGFFGLSPREARALDPQHRMLLEVGWDAMVDASLGRESADTGLFIGVSTSEYERLFLARAGQDVGIVDLLGSRRSAATGRLAAALGATGPAQVIDTDQSSSLVAVHDACESLRRAECGTALAGGVNLILTPTASIAFSQANMLSADGRCKFGDREADGFVRSDGVGVVVLKRLDDAVRDGDRIYAVIKGSAVRHEAGRGGGLTTPSVQGQAQLHRAALARAGVDPSSVQYVEAHGTGTPVGDAVEVQALADTFGDGDGDGCELGSIKSNIGHAEAAAGIAGLIKVALAMHHRELPASLHCPTPHPELFVSGGPVRVRTQGGAWPRPDQPLRAGVSAYGLTGTGAHVVLEQAPASIEATPGDGGPGEGDESRLLVLSSTTPHTLRALATRYEAWLAGDAAPRWADVCHQAATHSKQLGQRLSLVARSPAEARAKLREVLDGELPAGAWQGPAAGSRKIALVFPGQGGQWRGMGRALLEREPVFARAIQACEVAMRPHVDWSLVDELTHGTRFGRVDVDQPLLVAWMIAMARLWEARGLRADAVIGASMGEIAAAHIAGRLDLDDAMRVICHRSLLLSRIAGAGRMTAVGLGEAEAERLIEPFGDGVCVAVSNGPQSTVLAGDPQALEQIAAQLDERGVFCRHVEVPVASHSPQVDGLLDELRRRVSDVSSGDGTLASFSSCIGGRHEASLDADYWAANLRHPVRFAAAIEAALDDGVDLLLEISPHPVALEPMAQKIVSRGSAARAVSSFEREASESERLSWVAGELFVHGVELRWDRVCPGRRARLPAHPWADERYWFDDDATASPVAEPSAVKRRPSSPSSVPTAPETLAETLRRSPPGARPRLMEQRIAREVCRATGHQGALDPNTAFKDLGVTSVMSVGIASRLGLALERTLAPTLVIEKGTIAALARGLLGDPTFVRAAAVSTRAEPLAIVGMGCRFPGGVRNPNDLWQLLVQGRDGLVATPRSRWSRADLDAAEVQGGRRGGFIDDVASFDAAFFGISPREAEGLDPQQRLLLEVVWEALEDAGCSPQRAQRLITGVFVGMMGHSDYATRKARAGGPASIDAHDGTGDAVSAAAGRVSYALGLRGPALAVDTACSSSLVALHLACHSLRRGESDLAIVAGVNLMLAPDRTIAYGKAQMLSPDGICHTFDDSANGYVRGEGCGVLILERLGAARAAGRRVWAAVAGTATNQDGRSNGLTAPNPQAQVEVIRAALVDAGRGADDLGYIEAHGTGTPLGDPIELRALSEVLGPRSPIPVSSIKTNLGHLEGAAGLAGVMKAALSVHHGQIVPHLHALTPSTKVPWEQMPLRIPRDCEPWPSGRDRVAGVSSFGFSGTNAHAVVVGVEPPPIEEEEAEAGVEVFPLSAKTPAALSRLREQVAREAPGSLVDLCSTAALGRDHHAVRVAIACASAQQLRERLLDPAVTAGSGTTFPPVAFLFTGQGASVVDLGRELYERQPVFREAFTAASDSLRDHLPRPVLDYLFEPDAEAMAHTQLTRAALFCVQYAQLQLWRSWGIRPDYVFGHSVGEFAAACAAGVLTLEQAGDLLGQRGRLLAAFEVDGIMMRVIGALEDVEDALAGYGMDLSIASTNGPRNVVVAGDRRACESLAATLETRGSPCRMLPVSLPFHSPLMEPLVGPLEQQARHVGFSPPQIPMVATLTGELARPDEICSPAYWARVVRDRIEYARGIQTLWDAGCRVFLELGPATSLVDMGRACVPANEGTWLSSFRPGSPSAHHAAKTLARLYERGAPVDWEGVHRGRTRRHVSLPTYPFERTTHWFEAARPCPLHEVWEELVVQDGAVRGLRGTVGLDLQSYLPDHRVHGVSIVPGASLVELVLFAAHQGLRWAGCVLSDIRFPAPLIVRDEAVRVELSLRPHDDGLRFELRSTVVHATGVLTDSSAASPSIGRMVSGADEPARWLYEELDARGVVFGPSFRAIGGARWSDAGGHVQLEPMPAARYIVHPGLLDAALTSCAWSHLRADRSRPGAIVPTRIGRLQWWSDQGEPTAVRVGSGGESCDLVGGDGQVCARIEGLELAWSDRERLLDGVGASHAVERVEWSLRSTHPTVDPIGTWLVVGGAEGPGRGIVEGLRGAGAQAVEVEVNGLSSELETRQPRGIVFAPDTRESDPTLALQAHYTALLSIVQACARARVAPKLWLVTTQAQPVGVGSELSLSHAPLWAMRRVFGNEMLEVGGGSIDLPAVPSAADLGVLVGELGSDTSEIAIRGGGAWTSSLVDVDGPLRPAVIHADGTYLVTGGLGDLGVAVVQWLVERGAGHIIATSRRPQADRLGALASRVETFAADIADERQVATLFETLEQRPVLRGVIHAAGVIAPRTLAAQRWVDASPVLAPKVTGSWLLHRQLAERPLDFFVLFSSAVAQVGNPGQAAYAVGNAFLDALAHDRVARGQPATSIGWGPWSEIGMAARSSSNQLQDRFGLRRIAPADGIRLLDRIAGSGVPQAIVMPRGPKRGTEAETVRVEQAPAAAPAVAPAAAAPAPSGLLPVVREVVFRVMRLPHDSSVPAYTNLTTLGADSLMAVDIVRALEKQLGSSLPKTLVLDYPSIEGMADFLGAELGLAPAVAAPATSGLLPVVRQVVLGVMRLPSDSSVPAYTNLTTLGADSLMAVDIVRALEKQLGRSLPKTLVLDYPSIEGMADFLGAELGLGTAPEPEPAAGNEWTARVRQVVFSVMRFAPDTEVAPYTNLTTLGADSLMAVDIVRALEKELATSLPKTLVLDYPSIEGMADFLREGSHE